MTSEILAWKRRAYYVILIKEVKNMPRHYEDFTGKIINGMKIIGVDHNSGGAGKHKKWICECPLCLKQFSV